MPAAVVTTYYLEILDPRDLRPKRSLRSDLALVRIAPPMPELNRFFYTAAGAAWWFLCFHRLFPALLAPTRPDAPWPSVAFRRCLALFWLLSWITFVALFAWLSDELSGGLRSASWFSRNWKWLLLLLVGAVGALAIWAPRRPKTAHKG